MEETQGTNPGSPVVLRATSVTKQFTLRKDNSLKDRLLSFRNGRKHRESFTALQNVSTEVKAGHTVALIGHNGSGKSTLLKIMGGILDPSSGTIARRGRVAALLELGAGFHPDLSGRDNVYLNASLLGMSRAETEAAFESIVAFAELEDFIDTQVKFYSSGMYVRLAFAVAIHTNPDILLVDEVLAVGDEAFQRKCMDTIRRFQSEGRTILLVTHNLDQVLELADSAVLLHHGRLLHDGDPREAIRQFRTLLEEERVAHAQAVGTAGDQDAVAQILDVRLSPSKRGNSLFETGESISIITDFYHSEGVQDWIYAIQIDNTLGQKVIGIASDRVPDPMPPLQGRATFVATINAPMLGEGRYFANISMMSHGIHLADAVQAVSFEVSSKSLSTGMLAVDASFSRSGE